MKQGFIPISIKKYVNLHLEHNKDQDRKQLTEALDDLSVLTRVQRLRDEMVFLFLVVRNRLSYPFGLAVTSLGFQPALP